MYGQPCRDRLQFLSSVTGKNNNTLINGPNIEYWILNNIRYTNIKIIVGIWTDMLLADDQPSIIRP